MGCGADTEANELMSDLTTDVSFEIPIIDLDDALFKLPGDITLPMYGEISRLTNADLTTGEISGSGSFDALMRGFKAHLKEEFEKGRITGAEYSKAYTTLTQNAMAAGVQFLLGRDQAFWAAQLAQVQAITARVQLETTKVQLAEIQLQALNAKAEYALTKMKLSSESMNYCVSKYNLENILPAQKGLVTQQTTNLVQERLNMIAEAARIAQQTTNMVQERLNLIAEETRIQQQTENLSTENDIQEYTLANVLPKNVEVLEAEIDKAAKDLEISTYNLTYLMPQQLEKITEEVTQLQVETNTAAYNLTYLLPKQLAKITEEVAGLVVQTNIGSYTLANILPKQLALTTEQVETQRSQTLNTRTDGATITGSVGKQKDLYTQQITSYQRDAEVKAAKMFTDAWIAQKTIDEGLLPPSGFTNTSVDSVLTAIKANNGF